MFFHDQFGACVSSIRTSVQANMRTILALLSLLAVSQALMKKVRYGGGSEEQRDVFAFLARLTTAGEDNDDDPPAFTTPSPATSARERSNSYCKRSRGQFRFPPDCHR